MAKGNDGNYLQHSVEVAIALHLTKLSELPASRWPPSGGFPPPAVQGVLHLALTHGMAPFEPCGKPPASRNRELLQKALQAAQNPPASGESPIVAAYRATKASLDRYPNTGELLAAMIGRGRLSGGITEIDAQKHAKLVEVWSGSGVTAVNSSWRSEVRPGGVLSCPATLRAPWFLAADPMTFREDRYADDDQLYRADFSRVSTTLKGFVASGNQG